MENSRKLSACFKRNTSNKTLFFWNHYKNPNKRRKIEFSKNVKETKFRENFDFRRLCVSLNIISVSLFFTPRQDFLINLISIYQGVTPHFLLSGGTWGSLALSVVMWMSCLRRLPQRTYPHNCSWASCQYPKINCRQK